MHTSTLESFISLALLQVLNTTLHCANDDLCCSIIITTFDSDGVCTNREC